jgi:hypothetical protein
MKIFGLRVPFTGRRKLYGAARRSRRKRIRRQVTRYGAPRGAIAGAAGVSYLVLRHRRGRGRAARSRAVLTR